MEHERFLHRARSRGVNRALWHVVRVVFPVFFRIWFRLERIGRHHIPKKGGVILAANHRSFLDPFVMGCLVRRPLYFVAKRELFENRLQAWFLNALGAFPVDRGASDHDAMATAREILERGDIVVIYPEGTRVRAGGLGKPRRGVGRLALQTGAPVVPVAVLGTENIRTGWKIRPHKVRMRAGRPLTFPRVEQPSPQLAKAVTDRLWPCVQLQWEWLGGVSPIRRAAVIGAGSWGTALAVALQRAGVEVQLGCRTAEQAEAIRGNGGENSRYLDGVLLDDAIDVKCASDLELGGADLVCFAVPSRGLPAAVAAHGDRIPAGAGVVVLSKGLVAPLGTSPTTYVAERTRARAVACLGGPAHAADALRNGAAPVVASNDPTFAALVAGALRDAGLDATTSKDVIGVELAGAAKNAAVLAAAAAARLGPNAAGAAAGKVFAEIDAYARRCGGRPETFAGLAGAGDLVATVVAGGSRNRRAGELLAMGMPAERIEPELGQAAEALGTVKLLDEALRRDGVEAPALAALADLVDGRIAPDVWAEGLTAPGGPKPAKRAAAA